MALTVGELAGIIDLDDSGFQAGTRDVERSFDRMADDIERGLRDVEQNFDRMADEIGDAGREAARDLERNLERGLDGIEDAARDAGQDAGEGLADGVDAGGQQGMGATQGRLAGLMAKAGPWLAAGAAIGGVLLKAIEGAMEQQDVAAKLSAQVGAFGERSAELGDTAGELYAKGYGESMGDVGEALRGVIQNMSELRNASTKDLKEIAAGAMNVAEIMEEDVGAVTRTVGQMIRTGLAKDAKEAFDILVKGTQQGANAAEDLLETYNEYATQFRSMGLSGSQAMGLFVQGLRGGARDADVVADAVKEFSIEAVKGGDGVRKGFSRLGLDADAMVKSLAAGGPGAAKAFDQILDKLRGIEDPAKRNSVAFDLLGTKSEDMAAALYTLDPSSAVTALGQVDQAAKKAGDTLHDTASNRLETFKRGMQQGLVDFVGGPVLGALETFATDAQAAIQGWIDSNPEVIQQFRDAWTEIQGIFQGVADVLIAVWEAVGPTVIGVVKALVSAIGGIFGGLLKIIRGLIDVIAGVLTGDWSRAWNGLKSVVSGAVKVVVSLVRGLIKAVVAIVKGAAKLLYNAGKAIVEGLWNGIKSLGGWIKSKFTALIDDIVPGPVRKVLGWNSPAKLMIRAGKDIMRGLLLGLKSHEADKVKAQMEKIAEKIKKAFGDKASKTKLDDKLLELVKRTTKQLEGWAKKREKILNKLADMRDFRDKIRDSARSFASLTGLDFGEEGPTSKGIRAGLQQRVQQLKNFAKNIRALMKRGLPKSLLRQILEAGPEAGGELAEALVAGGTGDLKAISDAQKEIDSLSSSLGKLGMDAVFGLGVYEGLLREQKKIEALMDRIARRFAEQIARALSGKGGKGGMFGKAVTPALDIRVTVDGKGVMKGVRKTVRVSGGNAQRVLGAA
jgi:phage-related minor tail protein